jgi:hypothetical protein
MARQGQTESALPPWYREDGSCRKLGSPHSSQNSFASVLLAFIHRRIKTRPDASGALNVALLKDWRNSRHQRGIKQSYQGGKQAYTGLERISFVMPECYAAVGFKAEDIVGRLYLLGFYWNGGERGIRTPLGRVGLDREKWV